MLSGQRDRQPKVGIAQRYGLDGIAIWRLGLVTGEMWDALRATVIPGR
ncbi:hypothetical protein [Moorella sp. Hama-1]|nr:hypothetical protein [Moorella sp. Hama-1]BCV21029.1 hypothetical protein hamaS1_10980 [Moorella sp. Hama-1]